MDQQEQEIYRLQREIEHFDALTMLYNRAYALCVTSDESHDREEVQSVLDDF